MSEIFDFQNPPAWATPQWCKTALPGQWPAWAMAVDAIVFSIDQGALRVGVIDREEEPFSTLPTLLGGIVGPRDRDSREALVRVLAEKGKLELSWLENLATYTTQGRDPREWVGRREDGKWLVLGSRFVSEGYIGALGPRDSRGSVRWMNVSDALPWEWDEGVRKEVIKALSGWAREAKRTSDVRRLWQNWNDELSGERYRMLLEARLVGEARRDRWGHESDGVNFGQVMGFDHRLMLSDALGRIRGKARYDMRLVATLVGETFAWGQLVEALNAIWGREVHGANLRRVLVETEQYRAVEVTTKMAPQSGAGRPGRLYRFLDGGRRLETSVHVPWKASL